MRILHCHITGFGGFSNTDCDFTGGMNAFLEHNGWGKTTLCVYIKAMFFGMEYSPRKKELLEREHYRPWDGGRYGGDLIFETGGRRYRIERFFGRRDKEDTFALYNAESGLLSDDYTQNIGEEIFLVDRDAFEKSIFIPQGAPAAEKSDSISAKMGDLAAAQDDINHFDEAVGRLEEAKGRYTKRGAVNPGKLIVIKKEIADCREAAEKLPALSEGLEKQRAMLEEKRVKLHALEREKDALLLRITEQSKREQELGAYLEKKNTYARLSATEDELSAFFKSGLPSAEQIDVYDEMERRLEINRSTQVTTAEGMPEPGEAEKLNRIFKNRQLDQELIEQYSDQAERVLNLRVKSEHAQMPEEDREHLTELKVFFNKHDPSEEELLAAQEDAETIAQLDGQVQTLSDVYRALVAKSDGRSADGGEGHSSAFIVVLLASMVLFAGGCVLFAVAGNPGVIAGVVCLILGVLLATGACYLRVRMRHRAKEELERDIEEVEAAKRDLEEKELERTEVLSRLQDFLSYYLFSPTDNYMQMVSEIQRKLDLYERLKRREEDYARQSSGVVEELSALQVQLYTALMPYAEIYGLDLYERHEESNIIQKLKEDLIAWSAWQAAKVQMEDLKKEEIALRTELSEFIGRFGEINEKDLKEKLLFIRRQTDAFLTVQEQMERMRGDLEAFEASGTVDEDTVSVEELQEQQRQMDARIADLMNLIVKDKDMLSELTDEFEAHEEKSEALAGLEEREERYRKKAQLYEKTIGYLQEARERFLGLYMGPLRDGLRRYLSMVMDASKLSAEDFTLDMDLKVKFRYKGSTKDREYLSSGYRDLTSVCARLALMDVLYRGKLPPVILDDPFANLDDKKAKQALRMLDELAKSRQVIYFTCHPTRMPQAG